MRQVVSITVMADWSEIYKTATTHFRVGDQVFEHLVVSRWDGAEVCATWSELQAIKNEVIGKEVRMIEVFPEENRVINQANHRHFWTVPDDLVLTSFDVRQGREKPE